jgi:hypothetical protein
MQFASAANYLFTHLHFGPTWRPFESGKTVSCKTWNLEYGILESWNPGILESWNPGMLSYNRKIYYYQDIIIILMQHIVVHAII